MFFFSVHHFPIRLVSCFFWGKPLLPRRFFRACASLELGPPDEEFPGQWWTINNVDSTGHLQPTVCATNEAFCLYRTPFWGSKWWFVYVCLVTGVFQPLFSDEIREAFTCRWSMKRRSLLPWYIFHDSGQIWPLFIPNEAQRKTNCWWCFSARQSCWTPDFFYRFDAFGEDLHSLWLILI